MDLAMLILQIMFAIVLDLTMQALLEVRHSCGTVIKV
jgi:hypothetical protein